MGAIVREGGRGIWGKGVAKGREGGGGRKGNVGRGGRVAQVPGESENQNKHGG